MTTTTHTEITCDSCGKRINDDFQARIKVTSDLKLIRRMDEGEHPADGDKDFCSLPCLASWSKVWAK